MHLLSINPRTQTTNLLGKREGPGKPLHSAQTHLLRFFRPIFHTTPAVTDSAHERVKEIRLGAVNFSSWLRKAPLRRDRPRLTRVSDFRSPAQSLQISARKPRRIRQDCPSTILTHGPSGSCTSMRLPRAIYSYQKEECISCHASGTRKIPLKEQKATPDSGISSIKISLSHWFIFITCHIKLQ